MSHFIIALLIKSIFPAFSFPFTHLNDLHSQDPPVPVKAEPAEGIGIDALLDRYRCDSEREDTGDPEDVKPDLEVSPENIAFLAVVQNPRGLEPGEETARSRREQRKERGKKKRNARNKRVHWIFSESHSLKTSL